jgi:mannan endo-1,4-beta-mannosidase
MSAYVKSLDPMHLVGAGSINKSPIDLAKDLVISTIDFGTWHAYPIFDNITPEQLDRSIPQFCSVAALYHKPALLEEFGYARSNPDQIEAYRAWLTTMVNDRNCAGWMVWELVSRQQNGKFPKDDYDQFNVVRDGGPLWNLFRTMDLKAIETRR